MASRFQFALPDPRSRDGWTRVGNLDLTTTAILVIASGISMVVYAISPSLFSELAFHPEPVRSGQLWRLLTWPVANVPGLWTIITLAFFWFIGHAVEDLVGKYRYVRLVLIVTVLPALLVTLLPSSAFPTAAEIGLSLLGSVMFIIFVAEYPHMPFLFGIPAWALAAVFTGISVLALVGSRLWGSLILLLSAIAVGVITVRQWGFADRLKFVPRLTAAPRRGTGPHGPTRGPSRRPKRPRRDTPRTTGRGQVVSGPWAAPSTGTPAESSATIAAAQAELDALLDKISASGLDSLTAAEKQRLNELSKRLR